MLITMNSSERLFNLMQDRLSRHKPRLLSLHKPRAGVLVPFVAGDEPSVLLTIRADHLKSHPGEVAFPGGMWEPEDGNLQQTALRETHEELNLHPNKVSVLGSLSTGLSKAGVQVFPFVGVVDNLEGCQASPDEIASWFTVPWSFFATTEPELQLIERHGIEFHVPHFHYQGWHIWGLTAMIMLELINLVEETDWPLPPFSEARPPEIL